MDNGNSHIRGFKKRSTSRFKSRKRKIQERKKKQWSCGDNEECSEEGVPSGKEEIKNCYSTLMGGRGGKKRNFGGLDDFGKRNRVSMLKDRPLQEINRLLKGESG